MINILLIVGTRPEAIKLAPLITEYRRQEMLRQKFRLSVAVSGQHRDMVQPVLDFFGVSADYDLNIMKENQDLYDTTVSSLSGFRDLLPLSQPDLVVVQGDTTTSLTGSLAAFYHQIPVAHVEAGLRSQNKLSPYPEEMNRRLIAPLTDYHFAPTQRARQNLYREGITGNVWVVGNTVVDALLAAKKRGNRGDHILGEFENLLNKRGLSFQGTGKFPSKSRPLILVTAHRRESFGQPLNNICVALREISSRRGEAKIVFPVHLNPNVQKQVYERLSGVSNIHLLDPVTYPQMVWLLDKCDLILTDSGGIQEEAPSLDKPVLVMREFTERSEGIEAGVSCLVGTNPRKIVDQTLHLLSDPESYRKMAHGKNPYGDGRAAARIWNILSDGTIPESPSD